MASCGRFSILFTTAMALGACGSRAHHVEIGRATQPPLKAASQPRDPSGEPQPDPAPGTPERDFILSDEPNADPMQLLEATKHDCCDEASAADVQAGVRDQPSKPAPPRR